MKILASLLIILIPSIADSQTIIWNETFGLGCNLGQLATAYAGANGSWTVTNTGTNAGSANVWYVSATENGNNAGECGSGCGSDRSLHLGSVAVLGAAADPGAAYYEGLSFLCGFLPCGATNKRVESPVINLTGYSSVILAFNYIEGGNVIDNATLWYYNGSSWSQLTDLTKTFSGTCSPQGIWTTYSTTLPASADNNPNVKIGFKWINNDDGDATDPSFAVDDIVLSILDEEVDVTPPVVTCPADIDEYVDSNCQFVVPDYSTITTVTDDIDAEPTVTQDPVAGTVITATTTIVMTATDDAGNSSSCTFLVNLTDQTPPTILCPIDIEVTAAAQQDSAFVAVPLPDVSDNCSSVTYSNDFNNEQDASADYPVGTTIVIYVALDSSGNETSCSFNIEVLPAPCCNTDFNCDGTINVTDLLIFMSSFGTGGTDVQGDLNNDTAVNVTDLLIFMSAFGTNCP